MLAIVIDIAILMLLLKSVLEEDFDFARAGLLAVFTSIGTPILALIFAIKRGLIGAVLGVVIASVLLVAALWANFKVNMQQALALGIMFTVAHLCVGFAFIYMTSH